MSLYTDNKYVRLISYRLRNFKQKRENLYNFSCPICGDSKKNLLKARGYIYQGGNNLFYKCYNCGVSITAGNFIKHVDSEIYKQYQLERYKNGENGHSNYEKPKLTIKPIKFGNSKEVKENYDFAEWCSDLPEGHYCKTYVKNRRIPEEFYSKILYTKTYKQFVDKLVPDHDKTLDDDARLIIPFYDENGDLIAVTGRALENKSEKLRYVTIRTVESDDKLIYGLERLDKTKDVKIVEGPIDSMFLDNCVASGDANLMKCAEVLIEMGVDKDNIILVPDREPRNTEIVKNINKFISNGYKVCLFPSYMEGKDINEFIMNGISKDELEKIIQNNTYSSLKAKVRYVEWKKI